MGRPTLYKGAAGKKERPRCSQAKLSPDQSAEQPSSSPQRQAPEAPEAPEAPANKMKKLLVAFCALAVACVSAGFPARASGGPTYVSTGTSSQFRSEDNYGNYQFGYDETHASGSSGRRERRSGGVVRGSYELHDADGRQRTVSYVADAAGFRATIHTNEPGVDSARAPADVLIEAAEPAEAHAPVAGLTDAAPSLPAQVAPLPAAPVDAVQQETEPRAFSYSFGASHPVLSYAVSPAGALQRGPNY